MTRDNYCYRAVVANLVSYPVVSNEDQLCADVQKMSCSALVDYIPNSQ